MRDHRVLGRVQRAEQLRHLDRGPRAARAPGTYQTASVSNVVSGRSSATRSSVELVADRLPLVADDLLGDADAAEGELEAEPPLGAQRLLDRRHRLLLRLRVVVAARTARRARCARRGRARRRGSSRRGGGRSRPRGPSSTRARARSCRARVPVSVSTTVKTSGLVERRPKRAGGVVAAGPDVAGAASAPAPACSAARASASAPRISASASSSGASNAAAATCPSSTRGFSWSRIAASTRRPSSVSRLAHEVLVERVLARDQDGEPVAAAPGAAPLLAQARDRAGEADRDHARRAAPTSMPSSSAFVALTPSSSPAKSRCSISRRCAGV